MGAPRNWIGLRLDPLDVLFFRDGRPFDAANRVQGGLPGPQTLAGAIRTTLLARTGFFEQHRRAELQTILKNGDPGITGAHFRGPFVALTKDAETVPLLPMPVILGRAKEKRRSWSVAWPTREPVSGWADHDSLLPLKRNVEADSKADSEFLTLEGLRQFLGCVGPEGDQAIAHDELFGYDNRIGIAIDPQSLTSADGQLYAIRLLSLQPKVEKKNSEVNFRWNGWRVCLYAEMQPGVEEVKPYVNMLDGVPIPFGGEGKYVQATTTAAADWPAQDPSLPRSLWYLATPTFLPFTRESNRPLPANVKAAASGAGVAVSGWDVAQNGPNRTRFAVPAGACYFLDGPGGESQFLDAAQPDYLNLRQSGWGFALQGKWEDNRG